MIHALIRLVEPLTPSPRKARGDVIAVRLTSSPWGRLDVKLNQVVELRDDALEQRLLAMQAAGEKHPTIDLPYIETDEDGDPIVMSDRVLNLDAVPSRYKETWNRPDVDNDVIPAAAALIRSKRPDEKPPHKDPQVKESKPR